MKVERLAEIETTDIQIGDRIHVDQYTATCQEITPKGALFLMDQYLDKRMPMNKKNTNKGGYEESDLRKALQSEDVLKIFSCIREWMVPFDNGDLLRIPFFSEIFDQENAECFELDNCEQWELMKDRKNRIAFRKNNWEWGWLQNKKKDASSFASVSNLGYCNYYNASIRRGVRLAFLIATHKEAETYNS
jgi:hypothetical protein